MADDFAGDITTTGVIGQDAGFISGHLDASDFDWFRVVLGAPGTIHFSLSTLLTDPGLSIFDAAGNALSFAFAGDLTYQFASAGTYYVAVGSVGGHVGDYTLLSSLADDYSATAATTGVINALGGAITAHLGAGDSDWFKVVIDAPSIVQFSLSSSLCANIQLFDGSGTQIDISGPPTLIHNFQQAGIYYAAVSGISNSSGNYTLHAESSLSDDFAGSRSTTGVIVPDGGAISGHISAFQDEDWFRVTVTETSIIQFSLTSPTLTDGSLALYGPTGLTPLLTSGDQLVTQLHPGDYFVSVRSFGSHVGDYTLHSTILPDDHRGDFTTTDDVVVDGPAVFGNFEIAFDQDMFRVELQAGVPVQIAFSDLPDNSFLSLEVFDRYGQGGLAAGPTSTSSYFTFTPQYTGLYYLKATSENALNIGDYAFSILRAADDLPGDISTSGVLTINGAATIATHDFVGDLDLFAMDVATPGMVRIEFTSPIGAFRDTDTIGLYNASGTLIDVASVFFFGEGMNFQFDTPGRYYVGVLPGFTTQDARVYTITATTETDDFRGDTLSMAAITAGGPTINGAVEFNQDTDWFKFSAAVGDVVRFHLASRDGSTLIGERILLSDGAGSDLSTNRLQLEGGDIVFQVDKTADYFLEVLGKDAGDLGAYALTMSNVTDDFTLSHRGLLGVGAPGLGQIDYVGDGDIFAINVTAGETIRFSIQAAFHWSVAIRDGGDNFIDFSNSAVTDAPLVHTFDQTGVYYIMAGSADGSTGAYQLNATHVADDFGNTVHTAGHLVVGGPAVSGAINYNEDADWFSFTVAAGDTITIKINRGAGLHSASDLDFIQASGVPLPSEGIDRGVDFLTHTFEQAGTYFVEATGVNREDVSAYTISAQLAVDDFRSDVTSAGHFSVAGPAANGALEQNFDRDWFKIDLVAGESYVFTLAQTGGPFPMLAHTDVYNSLGAPLVVLPGVNDRTLVFTAQFTDSYFVSVTSQLSGGATYSLKAAEALPLLSFDRGGRQPPDFGHPHVGPDNVIHLYFASAGTQYADEVSNGWSNADTAAVMQVIERLEAYINVDFQVTDVQAYADIALTTFSDPSLVSKFFPGDGDTPIPVISFSTAAPDWTADGLGLGGLGAAAVLNAIGYALGMAFPHSAEGASVPLRGVSAFSDLGAFDLNQGVYTMMSFNDGWVTSPNGLPADLTYGFQSTPMAFDIPVLQAKFGATAHNTGNDTYVLGTPNGVGAQWQAIWDTGGVDTISYGGANDAVIDLRPATLAYEEGGGGFTSFVDTLQGGYTIANGVVIEKALGGSGADLLIGNAAANTLNGGGGDDVMEGGAGADVLIGGAGFDLAAYEHSAAGVIVNLTSGAGSGGDAQGDSLSGIEDVSGSHFNDVLTGDANGNFLAGGDGNDTLTGQAGADHLFGGAGADALSGGDGDDVLDGGAGADSIAGGAGIDIVDYSAASSAVSLNLQAGAGTAGDAAGDTYLSIENVIGSAFNDVLFGRDNVVNVIDGGDGDDRLYGGVGGADTLNGGNGVDTLDYSLSPNAVDVRLFSGFAAGGSANGDVYALIENIIGSSKTDTLAGDNGVNVIHGGLGNETITGRDGDDVLFGDGGNDTLLGGNGQDTLVGGAGADTLGGGADNDTVDYSASSAGVTVNLQTSAGSGGDAQGDAFVSIENVIGSALGDTIIGKNNWDNVLNGGAGADTLTGGTGNDTFVFRAGQASGDIITDFARVTGNHDHLQFLGYGTAGATFIRLDATHWQINSADGTIHDTIILANGATVGAGDIVFG